MAKPMTAAIAVFVRTPEISPVKTRLAADIQAAAARQAYEQSLAIITTTLRQAAADMPTLTVYWAVGEKEAIDHARWRSFPVLHSGDGELGARLANVYNTLRQQHNRVILIGSDSPQITVSLIVEAAQKKRQTVVGPAADGGFYLFASEHPIPDWVWQQTPYSCANTLEVLMTNLSDNNIHTLPVLADMDDKSSLLQVISELTVHNDIAAKKLQNIITKNEKLI